MTSYKVLFPYTGNSVGGSHVSSLMLARALRAAGHDVQIGLHQPGETMQAFLKENGFDWRTVPDVKAPKLRAFWRQWRARRRVRAQLASFLMDEAFDIVHTHDMRNHLIWGAATAGTRVRHVWHQRTPASGRDMVAWGQAADAFVIVSKFTRSSLPQALQPSARLIYNPFEQQDVASHEARARLCAELGVSEDVKVVGYVANFSDRKRPELFVEIAAQLRAQYDGPLVFAMFGAPLEPFASQVRDRAGALNMDNDLHIVGQRHPFAPVLAGLSVLVAPARNEALGRTLIEAGFAGVPLVATDEGGNREIVEDGATGWLVPPDDVAAFARAAHEALSNEDEAMRRTARAKTRVNARFSVQPHVQSVLGIYAELTHR